MEQYRMDLHQIPELGFKEFKTQEYILNHLKGYDCKIEIINTGILCFFDNKKTCTEAFRCDMDALPIEEKNNIPYKSQTKGLMHACGHDGHMAMMLGLADFLNLNYKNYNHNFLLIFQPSEEENCGARSIIATNFIERYNVKCIFGFHLWPGLPLGSVYSKPNELMAKSAEVNIKIIGKASHVANFENGIDALKCGAYYLQDIYQMEDKIDKKYYRLLKCGKMNAGTARNIIADNCELYITLRAYQLDIFNYIKESLLSIAKDYENKYGVRFEFNINEGYDAVINNETLFNIVLKHLSNKNKLDYLNVLKKPVLQAEDFGVYTSHVPSIFFFLGVGNTKPLHNEMFNFDMAALNRGLDFYKLLLDLDLNFNI